MKTLVKLTGNAKTFVEQFERLKQIKCKLISNLRATSEVGDSSEAKSGHDCKRQCRD